MNAYHFIEFGPTGTADAGARLRVQETPASLRLLMGAPQSVPGRPGNSKLR